MPEGLLTDSGTVTAGVHDDPDHEPEPTADAPRGWTWQRKDRHWAPRQRGAIKWKGDGDGQATRDDGSADSGAAAGQTSTGDRDPDPSWLRSEGSQDGKDDGKLKFDDVPGQVKDDIAGLAGLIGVPILSMLQQIDPYCGGALAQSYEHIVDACLPLICRSKKIVKYFEGDKSDWLLWGKLGIALKPFAAAVLQHHVLRTVEVVRDEQGRVFARPRARDEGRGDHLQPEPQPQFNYAA